MINPIELSKLYTPYVEEYEKAFSDFVKQGYFIYGESVEKFEKKMAEYLGTKFVVGCGNGTDALELALRVNGIGVGDEVITTANTYYATARAIYNTGAKVVFCDVDDNALIDINAIEALINEKTKAIIPVHLYGLDVDMDELNSIAEKYNLVVVEDCSHAFGTKSNGKYIGSESMCACFSLYPTKNLGAFGDAGFIATDSEELAIEMRNRRYYAANSDRTQFYENSIHSRLDSLQATLLLVSMKHIDEWNAQRKNNKEYYISKFKNKVPYFKKMEEEGVVPYVFPIICENQMDFYDYLKQNGINPQIHYKPELNKIDHLGGQNTELKKTVFFNNSVVSIPISQTVKMEEIEYITDVVCRYFDGEN